MSDGAGSFVVQCLTIMCVHVISFFFIHFVWQQSKIAWNSVVEEVVWSVLPCISQSVFALKARDERWSWKLCRAMFDHDVRSCFLLLYSTLCGTGAVIEDSMESKIG